MSPTSRRSRRRPGEHRRSRPAASLPRRRPCTRSATNRTIPRSGVTTPTTRASAAITASAARARNVDRRQRPGAGASRRTHSPQGQVVARPTGDLPRVDGVRGLCDVPGVPGRVLLLRALSLAVLLAMPDHRLRAGVERLRPAHQLVAAVPGADHPDLPAGLPDDLLLLPEGLLPGVLVLPAGLRGRRAAQGLHR